jgi:CBS domain-containing protein
MNTIGSTQPSTEAYAHDGVRGVSDIVELLPSAAQAAPVTAAMVRTVVCVDPEMGVAELMRLFVEQGISGAPVVDADGRSVGVVSKTDIVRELCENPDAARLGMTGAGDLDAASGLEFPLEHYPRRRVRHIMTPLAIFVDETASIARAAAIMAYERVHRVLVVDRAARVVGLVSTIDVLRWLARHDGYAVP